MFFITVVLYIKLNDWNINPIRLFLKYANLESFTENRSILLMNTFPNVGLSKAPMMFNNVDFPLPEGPITDTNSPFFIVKLMFFKAAYVPADVK